MIIIGLKLFWFICPICLLLHLSFLFIFHLNFGLLYTLVGCFRVNVNVKSTVLLLVYRERIFIVLFICVFLYVYSETPVKLLKKQVICLMWCFLVYFKLCHLLKIAQQTVKHFCYLLLFELFFLLLLLNSFCFVHY